MTTETHSQLANFILMVNLLLSPKKALRRSHMVKIICDPVCGTGGMLLVAVEEQLAEMTA